MITLIYHIPSDRKDSEVEWLREQKIFPAVHSDWDWSTNKEVFKIGIIVSAEQALAVKLRNRLDSQEDYKQR